MSTWKQIEHEAPEFAEAIHRRFDMGVNKTIATLRRDGAPRISAIEAQFDGGEITFGTMRSLKQRDILRDSRVAIHCPTLEAPPADDWPGDAKLAGTAVEIPAPPDNTQPGARFFRLDISEASITYVGTPADHLVVESWHPGTGLTRSTAR